LKIIASLLSVLYKILFKSILSISRSTEAKKYLKYKYSFVLCVYSFVLSKMQAFVCSVCVELTAAVNYDTLISVQCRVKKLKLLCEIIMLIMKLLCFYTN